MTEPIAAQLALDQLRTWAVEGGAASTEAMIGKTTEDALVGEVEPE